MNLLIIPDFNNLDASVELANEWKLNFEYNDFFLPGILDDSEEVRRRISVYKSLGRDTSGDTMHGAFLDITVHSDDRLIAKVSSDRIHACMDIAKELGVKGVVFHTNIVPNFRTQFYLDNWVKRNEEYWRKLIDEYPEQCVYIENMFDKSFAELMRLGERFVDEERFGVCLDYAHAVVFGWESPKTWVENLAPYISHMHINDNDTVADLHLPVGAGYISWGDYNAYMRRNAIDCSVLIEVSGVDNQKQSLEYMKSKHLFPFKMSDEDIRELNVYAEKVFERFNIQTEQVTPILYRVTNPDNKVNIDKLKVELRECALISSRAEYDEECEHIGNIYYILISVLDEGLINKYRQIAEAEYGRALVFDYIERKYDPSSATYVL